MPYVDSAINHRQLGESIGSGECVALVQAWTGAPRSASWTPGLKVLDNATQIASGTAIATFVEGHYPSTDKHAAIFLRGTADGFRVVDQWAGQGSHERTIHFGSHSRQNDPNAYYVIEP